MTGFRDILALPWVYRTWQAPFAKGKMKPVLASNDLTGVQRVLDVGCGPGTNAPFFLENQYLGLDINPRYIANADRRFSRAFTKCGQFKVQDVCQYHPPADEQYDFILLNSFLHHIDDDNTDAILTRLHDILDPQGHIHILDLVLPDRFSVARTLAKADRGDYARPLTRWQEIFSSHFEPVKTEPFSLKMFGFPLWKMVYFKGRCKGDNHHES
ncbi:MAG: class I SAM-dependent methyltransferase [Planctomycetota bacterium]|nr:class I SAM-dependent methyltransferase [Planctomycetota bacterium]